MIPHRISDHGTSKTAQEVAARTLSEVNRIRREVGEDELINLPAGSREDPDYNCPIARALLALVLPMEKRIAFQHPWHAAAATKLWLVPFADPLLLSVTMPQVIYDFAIAFRAGWFPQLEEPDAPPWGA